MNTSPIEYFKPINDLQLQELLEKHSGRFTLLTGGDFTPRLEETRPVMIDLQSLNKAQVLYKEGVYHVGGLVTLQELQDTFSQWHDLVAAISVEGGWNLRNSLSVDNFLRSAGARSPLLICLRALGAEVTLQPEGAALTLEEYIRGNCMDRTRYVETLSFAQPEGLAYEQVARTPKDLPILGMAVVKTRHQSYNVVCGGSSDWIEPVILADRAPETELLLQRALRDAGDQWASAEYRQSTAAVLLNRCLDKLAQEVDA